MADKDYARLACGMCSLRAMVESERQRRRAVKQYTGCEHEKPRFANGKERKFCFDCLPKPEPKPRKARKAPEFKQVEPAACAAPGCGKAFMKKQPRERFCSRSCQLKACSRATQESRRNSAPRPCGWCQTVFVPEYGSLSKRYCCAGCREASRRKVRSGSSHRRRAAKYGCTYEPISKRKVFERDGWRCYLCGRDTPRAMSGTTADNAPELDHVVPLAKGGPHSYANVRCCCRQCNRAKGAQLPAGQAAHHDGAEAEGAGGV